MKKRNLLAVIALLLVAITGGLVAVTYSRYLSKATGDATVQVAPWKVSVNKDDIVTKDTFTFRSEDINWVANANIEDGYIAPGRTGTFNIEIDPTGSKVAMKYDVEIDTAKLTALNNENIKIKDVKINGTVATLANGKYSGTISLADVKANKKQAVVVTVEWTDANTDTANATDTTTGSTVESFSLPVTVTVEQLVA